MEQYAGMGRGHISYLAPDSCDGAPFMPLDRLVRSVPDTKQSAPFDRSLYTSLRCPPT